MFAAHLRGINVAAQRATNAFDFVGGNGNAQARAAKDNPAFSRAAHDIRADFFGDIGIINARRSERANVFNLRIEFRQNFFDFLFEFNRAVVAANRYLHVESSFTSFAPIIFQRRTFVYSGGKFVLQLIASREAVCLVARRERDSQSVGSVVGRGRSVKV